MSAKIQSTPPKVAPTVQSSPAPVAQKAPTAQAQAPRPADALARPPRDAFDQARPQAVKQQDMATKLGRTSPRVIQQTSADNCGPAAALIAAGGKANAGVSNAKKMAGLEAKFTDGTGTTAQEMSQMLAGQGMTVKQAAFQFDQNTVDQTLSQGGKLVAMVDSNQIDPAANKQEAGAAHWVVIDGKDSQGNYTVQDPGTGTSYSVSFDTLSGAVDQAGLQHQGGGMLLVEDAKGGGGGFKAEARAQQNAVMTASLPLGEGNGSRGDAAFGRESS